MIAMFSGCLFVRQCEDLLLLNFAIVQTYIILIVVSRKKNQTKPSSHSSDLFCLYFFRTFHEVKWGLKPSSPFCFNSLKSSHSFIVSVDYSCGLGWIEQTEICSIRVNAAVIWHFVHCFLAHLLVHLPRDWPPACWRKGRWLICQKLYS